MSRQQVFDDPLSMFGSESNNEEPKREEPQPISEGEGSITLFFIETNKITFETV